GRAPGEPPPTLFEYVPDNALIFIDESHVTIPQIGGMYRGAFRRKATLADYGFRLPSYLDNRPLRFEACAVMRPPTIAVSATSGASRRWPNTASACHPAWPTVHCASRSGTPCARSPSPFRRRPAPGSLNSQAAFLPSRSSAPPA